MKTVGDRIRQAREYRRLSAETLAHRVGYKTQSGISNLENRAVGRGGFALPKIAEELNFSLEWFLQGPDTDNMAQVPPFRPHLDLESHLATEHATLAQEERASPWATTRQRAHVLIDQLSDEGLATALDILEAMAARHQRQKNERAGLHLPADLQKVG